MVPISMVFNNCDFRGKVDLTASVFEGDVSFYKSTFEQGVTFQDSIFQGLGHFVGTTFNGVAAFNGTTFEKRTSFAFVTFKSWASFLNASFQDGANFAYDSFQGEAYFRRASIKQIANFNPSDDFAKYIDFDYSKFGDKLDLTQAEIDGIVTFHGSTFTNDTFFVDLNKDLPIGDGRQVSIEFSSARFSERVFFQNSKLVRLSFRPLEPEISSDQQNLPIPSHPGESPTSLEKRAVFSGLQCGICDFSEAEFHDYVDFTGAKFLQFTSLKAVIFEQDVDFSGAEFPPVRVSITSKSEEEAGGVVLDKVLFQKSVNLDWPQISGKIRISSPDGWRTLGEAFSRSGDLQGQNECTYLRRIEEAAARIGWAKLTDRWQYWFWGYGIRPWRCFGWIVLVLVFFAALYFTQTETLATARSKSQDIPRRAAFSLSFALRTSWTLSYGYQNARTPLFKAVTLVNSVGIKLMLVCFFKALANLSPLLNDIIRKLVPW